MAKVRTMLKTAKKLERLIREAEYGSATLEVVNTAEDKRTLDSRQVAFVASAESVTWMQQGHMSTQGKSQATRTRLRQRRNMRSGENISPFHLQCCNSRPKRQTVALTRSD